MYKRPSINFYVGQFEVALYLWRWNKFGSIHFFPLTHWFPNIWIQWTRTEIFFPADKNRTKRWCMWRFFIPKINEVDRCGVGFFCFVVFASIIFFVAIEMRYKKTQLWFNVKDFPFDRPRSSYPSKKIECFHHSEKLCIFYASFIVRGSALKWVQITTNLMDLCHFLWL